MGGEGDRQPPRGGDKQLREALRRFRLAKASTSGGDADVSPGCAYGVMTRDAIEDLAQEVEDLRQEIRWVRATIVATIVTAAIGTVVRLAGW